MSRTYESNLLLALVCATMLCGPQQLRAGESESESALLAKLAQAQSLGATNPQVTIALVDLADFYRACGKFDEAEQYNRRAIANNGDQFGAMAPGTMVALLSLGRTLQEENKLAESELTLRNALVVASRQPTASNKGGQFRDINIFCNNVIANPRMLQGTPEVARAYEALADLFVKENRIQDAQRLYEQILEIYKPSSSANSKKIWLKLAQVYGLQGNSEKADQAKQRAAECSP
ncbi:MAG: tetratricopeptide repeat protein [Cyanobacteria bacterium SZAS-4]|nr:tetratricopeptide repeat protein [Cyanobacteria bacterium SZAS-4]